MGVLQTEDGGDGDNWESCGFDRGETLRDLYHGVWFGRVDEDMCGCVPAGVLKP
jgi:hypothetical protein